MHVYRPTAFIAYCHALCGQLSDRIIQLTGVYGDYVDSLVVRSAIIGFHVNRWARVSSSQTSVTQRQQLIAILLTAVYCASKTAHLLTLAEFDKFSHVGLIFVIFQATSILLPLHVITM